MLGLESGRVLDGHGEPGKRAHARAEFTVKGAERQFERLGRCRVGHGDPGQ
jgi:hypothetical protein